MANDANESKHAMLAEARELLQKAGAFGSTPTFELISMTGTDEYGRAWTANYVSVDHAQMIMRAIDLLLKVACSTAAPQAAEAAGK